MGKIRRRSLQLILICSLFLNGYFIFEILTFNLDASASKMESFQVAKEQADPSKYFLSKSWNAINFERINADRVIHSPLYVKKLIDYSFQFNVDSNAVRKFYLNQIVRKELNLNLPNKYDFTVLNDYLNLGNKYKEAAIYVPEEADLFNAISFSIYDEVSKKISSIQFKDKALSNKSDFQVLISKCIENNFYPDLLESSTDKFVKTLVEKDYFHLVNTSFQKTTFAQKLVVLTFLLLSLIGLITSLKFLYGYVKK